VKVLTGLSAIVVLVVLRRHVHGELWQLLAFLSLIYGILNILYLEKGDRREHQREENRREEEEKVIRNSFARWSLILRLHRMDRARKLARDQKPGQDGQE
jgi:hypothetical protein